MKRASCEGPRFALLLCLTCSGVAACDVGRSVFVPRSDVPAADVRGGDVPSTDALAADVPTADRPLGDVVQTEVPPTDAGTMCPADQTNCGGTCVDTRANAAHCGRCTNPCASLEVCSDSLCRAPNPLRFELQWDTPGNVDLQVVTPCNTTVGRPPSAPDACGGALDRDDTTGVGPENVNFADGPRGSYEICAVPVALGTLGLGMTTVTVNVFVGPTLMTTLMRTFNASNTNTMCAQGSQNFVGGFILP